MADAKLLPCPFCGTEAEVLCDDGVVHYVMCAGAMDCRICPQTSGVFRSAAEAAENWNRRAPVPVVPAELVPGDVVQVDPEHDPVFGGAFMQVTEPRSWGAQGFVKVPGGGFAYYRCPTEMMTRIGRAEWIDEHT
jgi:Lar family restriction alleviation protein